MRDVVHKQLCALLGPPNASGRSKKLWRWNVPAGFDVALQKETFAAVVWLPAPFLKGWNPEYAERYSETDGRHSNTHVLPSLQEGMPALCLRPETTSQVNDLLGAIRARLQENPSVNDN